MKIGFDLSHIIKPKKTGVGWYSYHLLKALTRVDRVNEYVLYTPCAPKEGDFFSLPDNFKLKELKWPFKRFWTQARLSAEVARDSLDTFLSTAYMLPSFAPKDSAVMIHDLGFKVYKGVYSSFSLFLQEITITRAKRRHANIIVPSEFTKQEFLKYYPEFDLAKVHVVPHGCDREVFKPMDNLQPVLSKYFPCELEYILFVGRFETKKNVPRIITAFKEILKYHPKLHLVLVGPEGVGHEEVKEYAENAGLNDKIIRIEFVAQDDLPYIIGGAKCFVFTTLYEGFGLPLLEAMACGAPIVASKGQPYEEVGGGACLYAEREDAQDIAGQINRMLLDGHLREDMIAKGFERVKQFSWDDTARRTLEVIK